ncbi:hypothetical protein NE237_021088 [Protea cynaroides]|uniref:Protein DETOXIFICATION n=1 Tax=Protea cynaroides TaxID=273540 RepID=A0A9Q0HAH0_9MAGN|nr:hypothetical protein NE237_021088 [Protea cynaroides]
MEEKMDRVLRLQPLAAPSSPPTGFVTASQTPDSSSSPISTPLSVPITKPYEVINPPQHPISSFHSSPIIPLPHPPLIRVNLPQPSTSLQPRSGMSVISRSLSGFPPRKPPAQNASAVQPMDCVYSRGDCVDRFNNSLKETGRSTGYANAQRTELFVTTSVRLHGRPPPTLVPLLRELLVDRNKPLKPPNPNLISLISLKLSAISLLTIVTSLESCRGFLQCDNNAVDAVQFYKNVFETEELKLGSSIVLHRNRFGNRSSLQVTTSLSSPHPQSISGVAFLTIVVKTLNSLYDPISKSTSKSVSHCNDNFSFYDTIVSALCLYREMLEFGVPHDSFTFPIINRAISSLGSSVGNGEMVQCLAIQMCYRSDLYFCNTMIVLNGEHKCNGSAHQVFDEMCLRDLGSWTSMIFGYDWSKNYDDAFRLFYDRPMNKFEPREAGSVKGMRDEATSNLETLTLVTSIIAKSGSLIQEEKKGVHGYVTKNLVYNSEEGIKAMEFSCSNTLIVPFNPETVSISNAMTSLLLQKAWNWLQGPRVYYLYRKLGIGREIGVFETSATSLDESVTMTSNDNEFDEFFEFTADDYFRKIWEAQEASRRTRITKAMIRVRFPHNCTLDMRMGNAFDTFGGQSYGAKHRHMPGVHIQRAGLVILLVSISLAFIWTNTGRILQAVGQDPGILQAGVYARFMIPSLFACGLLQCHARFLQTQNIVFPIMISSGITALLHIFVCGIFVFKSGLGYIRAALANSNFYWVNVISLAFYVLFSPACNTSFSKEALHGVLNFIKLAISSIVMVCLGMWSFDMIVLLSRFPSNPKLETSSVLSNGLDARSNTSYAFNKYYQTANQPKGACQSSMHMMPTISVLRQLYSRTLRTRFSYMGTAMLRSHLNRRIITSLSCYNCMIVTE